MSEKRSTKKQKKEADPKYPPDEPPDEVDPDDEESWPDLSWMGLIKRKGQE